MVAAAGSLVRRARRQPAILPQSGRRGNVPAGHSFRDATARQGAVRTFSSTCGGHKLRPFTRREDHRVHAGIVNGTNTAQPHHLLRSPKSCLTVSFALPCCCVPQWPPPPGPKGRKQSNLPLKRVVLFSSGVGFFEHAGQVNDDAKVEMKFKTADINDLLKSMVVQDLDGGQVSTVTYGSKDPITKTLKGFSIDLTTNPTLAQLLQQLRGERVVVEAPNELSGVILGVETRKNEARRPRNHRSRACSIC